MKMELGIEIKFVFPERKLCLGWYNIVIRVRVVTVNIIVSYQLYHS